MYDIHFAVYFIVLKQCILMFSKLPGIIFFRPIFNVRTFLQTRACNIVFHTDYPK